MRTLHVLIVASIACLMVGKPAVAEAQAYCALRDPVRTIYQLYPDATSYRSIVATVGESARSDIASKSGLTLHHGELGRHTLYVALRGDRPIGLVHVRAESTRWGLTEVAWALDFDLRVVDFRIQRSRSASRNTLESEAFRTLLKGRTSASLASTIAPGAARLVLAGAPLSENDQSLVVAVVTSGVKAIAATDSVWGADIARLRAAARASR